MPIADYQTIMLPHLRLLADGGEHTLRDLVNNLADEFHLTEAERAALLPSGTQPVINNRVYWAKKYLQEGRLLETIRRGAVRISSRGRQALATAPTRIDTKYLEQFPEFVSFRSIRHEAEPTQPEEAPHATPQEALETAYQRLRGELEAEVLDQVKKASPAFFERLVIQVLVAMGYGGTLSDAGKAVGRSGDGGIDGIIKEDRLGLDVIYVQAKRWENSVGRPEVQKFAGALQGQRARKGILITTSTFTKDAQDFAAVIDSRVVLIDGPTLAALMIDHNVGVTPCGHSISRSSIPTSSVKSRLASDQM